MTEVDSTQSGDDDGTLAGYFRKHDRPPAFEAPDGHPYTVSVEAEYTCDLRVPYLGYLVFPRWAQTGVGIVGHVETPTLVEGQTAQDVEDRIGALTLPEVKHLLDEAVERLLTDERAP